MVHICMTLTCFADINSIYLPVDRPFSRSRLWGTHGGRVYHCASLDLGLALLRVFRTFKTTRAACISRYCFLRNRTVRNCKNPQCKLFALLLLHHSTSPALMLSCSLRYGSQGAAEAAVAHPVIPFVAARMDGVFMCACVP